MGLFVDFLADLAARTDLPAVNFCTRSPVDPSATKNIRLHTRRRWRGLPQHCRTDRIVRERRSFTPALHSHRDFGAYVLSSWVQTLLDRRFVDFPAEHQHELTARRQLLHPVIAPRSTTYTFPSGAPGNTINSLKATRSTARLPRPAFVFGCHRAEVFQFVAPLPTCREIYFASKLALQRQLDRGVTACAPPAPTASTATAAS